MADSPRMEHPSSLLQCIERPSLVRVHSLLMPRIRIYLRMVLSTVQVHSKEPVTSVVTWSNLVHSTSWMPFPAPTTSPYSLRTRKKLFCRCRLWSHSHEPVLKRTTSNCHCRELGFKERPDWLLLLSMPKAKSSPVGWKLSNSKTWMPTSQTLVRKLFGLPVGLRQMTMEPSESVLFWKANM